MKLLREFSTDTQNLKCEENGAKNYYIKGIFLEGEIVNRNGRIYPITVLDKAVRAYNQDYIDQNRSYGELSHPDNPNVNFHLVSHRITELTRDGNNFIGQAKILPDLANGKIVKSLMDDGCKFGVSSRGLGSLFEKNNKHYVKDDYIISAIDLVSDPSGPHCYVENIMEGKEWIMELGAWVESYRTKVVKPVLDNKGLKKSKKLSQKIFEQATSQQVQEVVLLAEWEKLINELKD